MGATRTTTATARDIMSPDPVCAEPSMLLREVAAMLAFHEISGVPVVGPSGRVVGVVSASDVIRQLVGGTDERSPGAILDVLAEGQGEDEPAAASFDAEEMPRVEDIMTADPITVTAEVAVEAIARTLREHRVHRVIVVDDDGGAIGIISSLDVLSAVAP